MAPYLACESVVEVADECDDHGKVAPSRLRVWRSKCTAVGVMWATVKSVMMERNSLLSIIVLCCVGIIFLVKSRYNLELGPWHAQKMWHYPVEFPRCSMDVCFDFSRCDHQKELLVYTYNDPAPADLPTYFNILPGSKWHTNNPEKACLFFVFSDTVENRNAWTKPDPRNLPHWNGGLNHVFVTFQDRWEETNPPARAIGMASILSTELHSTTYRPNFDIAIPLPRLSSKVEGLSELKSFERKYFLTFKGTRYLSREGNFRSSPAFRGMHNGEDVVVATTCNHETNNKLLRWQPWRGAGCQEDQILFDRNVYTDLLNTTFGLAPAGRSPASYRMLEVLSAGAIPVLIADNYVKPFDTLIQWQRCLVQFPTSAIHRILPTLRAMSKGEVEIRQQYCKQIFHSALKDDNSLLSSVMQSFKQRFMGMLPNFPLTHDDASGSETGPLIKLPHIIGTEEFTRDIHCGLADFKFPEVNARASSLEPVESGSDTDRDEARMAAEMVGERTWLDGGWSASEIDTSGHQGGVLEPAVSAALDFKAMLEAALRGPSFPYDGGIIPNLENAHGQHSFVDSTTLGAHDTDSVTPRARSEPGDIKLDGDLTTIYGQTPVEDNMQHLSPASGALLEVNKTVLLLPPPIQMPPAFTRNDYSYVTGSMGPQSPSTSTPTYTTALNSPRDRFRDDLERSLGISPRSDPLPQGIMSTAKIQNTAGSSLLHTEENKPRSPSQVRPSNTVTEDLPMPTLPDGLFQGLQVAIQARQLRSQSVQRDEVSLGKEVMQRPDVGEVRSPIPAEKSITSRLSPVKLNLKDNRGPFNKSKAEPTSRLQKESKGVSPSVTTPGPISFQGGLFDDDDDDMDESIGFFSKEVTETTKDGSTKFGGKQISPFMGPLAASSTVVRLGLVDDPGDLSTGSPSGSEANSGVVERSNAIQQSPLSLPGRGDAKRSTVLNRSLFGDSDNEDSE